ncbi:ferredoxin [Streptomyces sp. TX20-6-3]|uniref:ferredoxin n=1 Tax=Streptomyces sp. TX20-6-3 TaxID=3028705 RepID=UPI0029A92195|nr:ferredoxin [Streptomyces sp. TX20-6-3]MDX2561347.1 ferredoxin [Streptomyces sp. TX20-6-3]
MRISIDAELCIGAGQCAMTSPDVFTQDDDGFGMVVTGQDGGTGGPLVREAARACPVRAISVEG